VYLPLRVASGHGAEYTAENVTTVGD
jgi:hypothetical protein